MKLNPRVLLRLSSNLTLWLIILCGAGMILWLIDTVLNWDILPDFIDLYVELILSVFAVITGLSILVSIICVTAIGGEFLALKAQMPDKQIDPSVNRKVAFVTGGLIVLLFSFYGISNYRQNTQKQVNFAKNEKDFKRTSHELDSALSINFSKVESNLILYIDSLEDNESNLAEMIVSIERSLPHNPKLGILISGKEHYKYQILDVRTFKDGPILNTEKLLSLPTLHENDLLNDIIKTGGTALPFKNDGTFFNAIRPHAWKKTTASDQSFIVLMLKAR